MTAHVLARQWRPKTFDTVVGQAPVLQALQHALDTKRLHHAYLFTGTRGVGKTTLARLFAKAVNCEKGITSTPCGACSACLAIDAGRFVDLIEVDAASRTKVEDTRDLLDNVQYAPTQGRYKIYLIDEVHMLSGHSFNALLKTLEEPPAHVLFLLATTDPQKLPITVLSRCLQLHLKHVSEGDIAAHLTHILQSESMPFEPEALNLIAAAGQGSVRDALSLLDQAIAYSGGRVTALAVREMLGALNPQTLPHLLAALAARDGAAILAAVEAVAQESGDFAQALRLLMHGLHDLALWQTIGEDALASITRFEVIQPWREAFSPEDLQLYYQMALQGVRDLPFAANARVGFQMTLLRMLAFTPLTVDTPPRSASAPVAAPVRVSAPTTPALAKEDDLPWATEEEPVTESFNTVKMEPPPTALSLPVTETPISWDVLLSALKLTGMAATLASHCVLVDFQDQRMRCALSKFHAPLYNKVVAARIEQAISDHLKQKIRLEIEITDVQIATPAEHQAEARNAAWAKAKETLEADPIVAGLRSDLGAKIDESSILPVNLS